MIFKNTLNLTNVCVSRKQNKAGIVRRPSFLSLTKIGIESFLINYLEMVIQMKVLMVIQKRKATGMVSLRRTDENRSKQITARIYRANQILDFSFPTQQFKQGRGFV